MFIFVDKVPFLKCWVSVEIFFSWSAKNRLRKVGTLLSSESVWNNWKRWNFFFHYFSLSGAIYEIEKEFLTQFSPMLCFPTMNFERRQLHCCWGCQLPLSSLPCKVKQSLFTWTDLVSTLCLLQASVSSSNNTFPGKNYATGYLFKWLNIVIRIISIAPYCLSNFFKFQHGKLGVNWWEYILSSGCQKRNTSSWGGTLEGFISENQAYFNILPRVDFPCLAYWGSVWSLFSQ